MVASKKIISYFASPHNGQFYIESRKIIFSGPKFVSNSFD